GISIRNKIKHSRHSQAAHDLGCSENFHFNQRHQEQRRKKQPGHAALLQVALKTKQPRKKDTQCRKDWIGIEEWQNRGQHTEVTQRPIKVLAAKQSRNKRKVFTKRYEEHDQSTEISGSKPIPRKAKNTEHRKREKQRGNKAQREIARV